MPENMECHERDSWKVRQNIFHFSKTETTVNKTGIFDVTDKYQINFIFFTNIGTDLENKIQSQVQTHQIHLILI